MVRKSERSIESRTLDNEQGHNEVSEGALVDAVSVVHSGLVAGDAVGVSQPKVRK